MNRDSSFTILLFINSSVLTYIFYENKTNVVIYLVSYVNMLSRTYTYLWSIVEQLLQLITVSYPSYGEYYRSPRTFRTINESSNAHEMCIVHVPWSWENLLYRTCVRPKQHMRVLSPLKLLIRFHDIYYL